MKEATVLINDPRVMEILLEAGFSTSIPINKKRIENKIKYTQDDPKVVIPKKEVKKITPVKVIKKPVIVKPIKVVKPKVAKKRRTKKRS